MFWRGSVPILTGIYISKKLLFQTTEEANEIQRSPKNYFSFSTSEHVYVFGVNKNASSRFAKMMFVA